MAFPRRCLDLKCGIAENLAVYEAYAPTRFDYDLALLYHLRGSEQVVGLPAWKGSGHPCST